MTSSSFTKHHASLSIEDIVEQPEHAKDNWLLTYLDVFVLIIMLVITLMALKDFEREKNEVKQSSISKEKPNKNKKKNTATPPIKTIFTPQVSLQLALQKDNINKSIKKVPEQKPSPNKKVDKNKLQKQLTKTIKDLGLNNAIDLKVTLGYAQLEIQDKILFKSSEANLLSDGDKLLEKIAPLLDQSLGLIFIEGHTDNRPIKTDRFPSNWELGATRATNVLHFLETQNIDTSRLRAISSAATKPIADNATAEGREKNRRVSIMIQVADQIN